MLLKRVYNKLFHRVSKVNSSLSSVDRIGINSEIRGHISKERAPKSRITIGNNCLILGSISLETNEAIITIGDNVYVGEGTIVVCSNRIDIESDILISSECIIQDSDNHSIDFNIRKKDLADWKNNFHDWSLHPCLPIKLEQGCWIGTRTIILKGVVVGTRSVVGAASVVTKDVDPLTIVAGNPARAIRKIDEMK